MSPEKTKSVAEPFGMQFLETVESPGDVIGGNIYCNNTYTVSTWIFFSDKETRLEVDAVEG